MIDEFEADPTEVRDVDLSQVASLARQAQGIRNEIEAAEALIALKKKDLRAIVEIELPNIMATIGLEEFKLSGGGSIKLKTDAGGYITQANQPRAFSWLIDHGHESLIKRKLTAAFGKGENDLATKLALFIKEHYAKAKVTDKRSVHPQTLGAFVREQIAAGELTEDMSAWEWLGVYQRRYADILLGPDHNGGPPLDDIPSGDDDES